MVRMTDPRSDRSRDRALVGIRHNCRPPLGQRLIAAAKEGRAIVRGESAPPSAGEGASVVADKDARSGTVSLEGNHNRRIVELEAEVKTFNAKFRPNSPYSRVLVASKQPSVQNAEL